MEGEIKSGKDLFGNYRILTPDKSKKTERGELLRLFMGKLNPSRVKMGLKPMTEGRLAMIFQGIPTEDLYFIDSRCSKSKNYSKTFWWEINPKKHIR